MSFEQPKIEQLKKPAAEGESRQGREEEKAPTISEAKNFDELYEALDAAGGFEGRERFYDASELKEIIERVRAGYSRLNKVTGTEGLREKVSELALKEQEERVKEEK